MVSFIKLIYLLRDGHIVLLVDRVRHVDHAIVNAGEKTFKILDDFLRKTKYFESMIL